jgi:hypothetical protein
MRWTVAGLRGLVLRTMHLVFDRYLVFKELRWLGVRGCAVPSHRDVDYAGSALLAALVGDTHDVMEPDHTSNIVRTLC